MKKRLNIATHTVSIIRSRGQLTIPDSIRTLREWTSVNSPVVITSERSEEIVIRPHKKEFDWDQIWKGISKVRALKGKGSTTSTAEFLVKDRKSH